MPAHTRSITLRWWLVVAAVLVLGAAPAAASTSSGDDGGSAAAPTPADSATAAAAGSGYWMVGVDGQVYAFGAAHDLGEPRSANAAYPDCRLATLNELHFCNYTTSIESTPSGNGYWVLDTSGVIRSYGDAIAIRCPRRPATTRTRRSPPRGPARACGSSRRPAASRSAVTPRSTAACATCT